MEKIKLFILSISLLINIEIVAFQTSNLVCKNETNLSWTSRSYPKDSKIQKNAEEFFKEVGNNVLDKLKNNELNLRLMDACLKEKLEEVKLDDQIYSCSETNSFFKYEFYNLVSLVRYELALSSGQLTYPYKYNEQLNSIDGFEKYNWEKLSKSEIVEINTFWKKELNLIIEESKSSVHKVFKLPLNNYPSFGIQQAIDSNIRKRLITFHQIHQHNYRSFLQEFPLLATLKSEKPSVEEIRNGISILLKNNIAEAKSVQLKLTELSESALIPNSSIELLKYDPIVLEVLSNNLNFCKAALLGEKIVNNRVLHSTIASIPLIGVTFFAPPLWGIGIGSAISAIWLNDIMDKQEQDLQSSLISFFGEDAILPLETVRQNSQEINFQIATLPLVFVGGGKTMLNLANKSLSKLARIKINN